MKRLLLTCALLLALSGPAAAWSPWEVWLGNRAYGNGDYAEAAERYRKALEEAPEDAAARLNLGDALYQQGKYAEAAAELTKAAESPSPSLRARASYELGNARFQQEDWAGAVEAYKTALRWNEDDEDARHNLQVALDKLKNPQGKPPEQKPPQQPPPSGGSPSPNPEGSPSPNPGGKPSPNPGGSPSPNPGGSPSPNPAAKPSPQPGQPGKPGQASPAQPQPAGSPGQPKGPKERGQVQGLTKEDAERLLRYFRERERQNRPVPRAERRLQPPRGTETW